MAACYRHPSRETNVGCSNCGRPICPDCMTVTPVGMRCPECSREKTQVRRAPAGFAAGGAAPATFVLIALNALAFVGEIIGGGGAASLEGGGSVIRDFGIYGPSIDAGEPYRIVSGAFLHAGPLHLILNMVAVYFLGSLLEPAIGARRFVSIYVVALLGGSFGALLLDPLELTVGASGAVFGLMAAGYLIARERGLQDVASQIGLYVVLNLAFTFSIPGISIGGHLGGLLAGGLLAYVFGLAGRRREPSERLAIEILATVALAGICLAGALIAAASSVDDLLAVPI